MVEVNGYWLIMLRGSNNSNSWVEGLNRAGKFQRFGRFIVMFIHPCVGWVALAHSHIYKPWLISRTLPVSPLFSIAGLSITLKRVWLLLTNESSYDFYWSSWWIYVIMYTYIYIYITCWFFVVTSLLLRCYFVDSLAVNNDPLAHPVTPGSSGRVSRVPDPQGSAWYAKELRGRHHDHPGEKKTDGHHSVFSVYVYLSRYV